VAVSTVYLKLPCSGVRPRGFVDLQPGPQALHFSLGLLYLETNEYSMKEYTRTKQSMGETLRTETVSFAVCELAFVMLVDGNSKEMLDLEMLVP